MIRGLVTFAASLLAALLLTRAFSGANPFIGFDWFISLLFIIATWIAAWALSWIFDLAMPKSISRFLVPALFGLGLIAAWEAYVRSSGIAVVLLPSPAQIATKFAHTLPTLGADFVQTFIRAVIPGWLIGCGAGFFTALACDRNEFLKRGLLPFGNLVAALPIVGVAPILVMWFGFDWPSKAAMVVVMTFFPMLINTLAGLTASGHMERDLMKSYGADWFTTLLKLRLPAAMPFVFNALKINSTLAMIGAIVAEFFGTPIVGMGFRMSTEVGRQGLDMVWAEILVAALTGSTFYGLLTLFERGVTFWHPSYRR
jgi:NitT/TauT family transport system permease protein